MKTFFSGLILLFLLITSCETNGQSGYSTVTGKVGEVLVVTETSIWEKPEMKHCLDSNLTQFIMPYFPDVATFELIHKTPAQFENGVKRYRNVLFIILIDV